MIKTFTLKSFNNIHKTMLIAIVVMASAFVNPNIHSVDNGSIMQPKVIKCYPNPAISFVNFEVPVDYTSKGYVIQVFSFTGKKMFEQQVASIRTTLTFNGDFYRGIYIYQLEDKSGKVVETGKFQINK